MRPWPPARLFAIDEAAAEADMIMMVLPDPIQAKVYEEDIAPNLKDGDALAFIDYLEVNLSGGPCTNVNPVADMNSDGHDDGTDNCPLHNNPDQSDLDGDGVGDLCDNSPQTNPGQADEDGDGNPDHEAIQHRS